MSKYVRQMMAEPTELEKELGTYEYAKLEAEYIRDIDKRISEDPRAFVVDEIKNAKTYLEEGKYLSAKATLGILLDLAKERNLKLPDGTDRLYRKIIIEGSYGIYREYLANPEKDYNKGIAQSLAEEGGIRFSDVESARGIVEKEKIEGLLNSSNEGCLRGLFRGFGGGESKG